MKLSGIVLAIMLFDLAAKSWILLWSAPELYIRNDAGHTPQLEEQRPGASTLAFLPPELFVPHAKYLSAGIECQACHDYER